MLQVITGHKEAFDQAKTISKIGEIILYTSTGVALFTSYSEYFWEGFENINEILNIINIVLIFLYVISELVVNSILPKAELRRRLGYIDNSFDTNFSGKKSENYYNNDKLNPGLIKLAANCFESSLFTFNISKKMIWPLATKNILVIIVFLLAAYIGDRKILILISQLTLPIVLIQQLVKLCIYVNTNQLVLDNFRELFTELRDHKEANKAPQIIRNIIHYESNISWASIILDSNLYDKLNPSLSQEWENYKKEYNIV
ncbi:MAG: hypothetical protein U0V72_00075 [Cytophagales bacterium]